MNMVALYNMVHKCKEKWKLASVGPVEVVSVPVPCFGKICVKLKPQSSVPDPDPYVFWTSRIRIRNYMYGFGSGSFHQQAKKSKKNLDLKVLLLLMPYYL